MRTLNEKASMRDYMRVTECSEGQARSVYIFLDALVVTEEAEDFDLREARQGGALVAQDRSESAFPRGEAGRLP